MSTNYPSDSVTETLITQIENLGGTPTSYGLGELMRLLADLQGGGGGWPSENGSGPGNLVAQTASDDMVGYIITDQGSGGITLNAAGTGDVIVEAGGSGSLGLGAQGDGSVALFSNGSGVVNIFDGGGGVLIESQEGSGGVTLESASSIAITPGSGGMTDVLSYHAGHLASDYDFTTSLATFLTTASFAVGTWSVDMKGSATVPASCATEYEVNAGTATATFEGASSDDISAPDTIIESPFMMSFIATVTVAGTLVFQAIANTTSGTPTIKATTGTNSYAKATGYKAVKIG